MWLLGRQGGYFCGPDQGLPFPESHRRALKEAIAEYGVYPLKELPGEPHAIESGTQKGAWR
jgi:hypothetical protein